VINKVIDDNGFKTAAEVGCCLKAGTNCGSCVQAIVAIQHRARQLAGATREVTYVIQAQSKHAEGYYI
jgi:NAD(P)H-nitrite reductase large subunit